MRTLSVRTKLISGVAIAGAVIWGLVEFVALQWSGLSEWFGTRGRLRAV